MGKETRFAFRIFIVCMYVLSQISQAYNMDQAGKVANPARGQLIREK